LYHINPFSASDSPGIKGSSPSPPNISILAGLFVIELGFIIPNPSKSVPKKLTAVFSGGATVKGLDGIMLELSKDVATFGLLTLCGVIEGAVNV